MVARLSRKRAVMISSAMDRLVEDRLEHRRVEASRVLVVAGAMVAIDQSLAVGQSVLRAMREFGARERHPERPAQTVVGNFAERDEGGEARQARGPGHQILTARGLLLGQ